MTDPGGLEVVLVRLTDRVLAGESVDLEVAVRDHPEHETGIREAWPRILSLVAAFDDPLSDTGGIPVPRGYRARGPVHQGGQGRIVEIVDEETGSVAAFKVMTGDDRDSIREILAFDRLRGETHPAVVKVHSVSGSGILMELLEGPDLADLIDLGERPGGSALLRLSQHLPERRTVTREVALAFAELARGLATLHERGILHRDLKPHNVKVVRERGLVLFDLGIARVEHVETISDPDTVLGTIPFMAPEAVPGSERAFDERTDVYGLGATLYSILTNRYPHAGADALECLLSVRTKNPQPISSFHPDLPRGLAQIAEKAMARQPEDRYESALELAQDLERFAAGKRALAEISREARRRRKRTLRLSLATAGVLAVLLAAFLWRAVEGAMERRDQKQERDRAARVVDTLGHARRLGDELRVPEALDVVESALEDARGPAEKYAVAELKASLLNATGQTEAAAAVLAPHLEAGATPGIRSSARTVLAGIHADVGDYRKSYRLLIDREEESSDESRHVLLDSVLRLGRTGQAQRLLTAIGDEELRTLLDRFRLLEHVPAPGMKRGTAIRTEDGETRLILSAHSGELRTLTDGAARELVTMPYAGDPIQNPGVFPSGRPGEVAVIGSNGRTSGSVALIDVASGRTVRRWDNLRIYPTYSSGDVTGDGRLDHIIRYQVHHRGVDIFDADGRALPLGDMDELNHAIADVRGFHVFRIPGDPAPRVLVGTGPWDQTGLGFSLLTYRFSGEKGFIRERRVRIGDVAGVASADLDGDGTTELYVSIYPWPTRELSHVYADFRKAGVYRVDPAGLKLEPVALESWSAAYLGPTGDVRQVYPVRMLRDMQRIALGNGRDALACSEQFVSPGSDRRSYVRILMQGASGPRLFVLPAPYLPAARLTVGDVLADSPGEELAVVAQGELYVFGAGRNRDADAMTLSLPNDSWPPPDWQVYDRRQFGSGAGTGNRMVCEAFRGDGLLRPVHMDGLAFRYRVKLTIREMDWAGALRVGLFGPSAGPDDPCQYLCLTFLRSSYGPRALDVEYRGSTPRIVVHNLEIPGSYRLAWGTPIDCIVEYSPDPPSLLVTCRDEATGTVLHRLDRPLPGPLDPGDYSFGVRGEAEGTGGRATTYLEVRHLELLPFGEITIPPGEDPTGRNPARVALENAHFALLEAARERARREFRRAMATGSDLAPLLVGPFDTCGIRLACLAIEEAPPADRSGLRERLISLATAGSYAQNDPELAVGLFEATGVSEDEKDLYVAALKALGRTREAFLLEPRPPVPTFPEPQDAAARLSFAGIALRLLHPRTSRNLIRPILADAPSVRASVDALLIDARAAMMEGDRDLARTRIRELEETPGFEVEQLRDYADIRRFLSRED